MNFFVNINHSSIVAYTNKLEKLHKSAFPAAVRGTLNGAAFDVKQKSMPISAEKHFEKRKPNFFKANSKVIMATGYDVSSMKSTVGFISSNLRYNNKAVKELQQQEQGGQIPNRSLIPLDTAREGDSYSKPVRATSRLKQILTSKGMNGIVDARKQRGVHRRQKFLKAALKAGVGGFVIGGLNKDLLYRINSIRKKGRNLKIRSTPIYSYRKGRSAKIDKATHFMREASLNSAQKLEQIYIKEATRQFAKIK